MNFSATLGTIILTCIQPEACRFFQEEGQHVQKLLVIWMFSCTAVRDDSWHALTHSVGEYTETTLSHKQV